MQLLELLDGASLPDIENPRKNRGAKLDRNEPSSDHFTHDSRGLDRGPKLGARRVLLVDSSALCGSLLLEQLDGEADLEFFVSAHPWALTPDRSVSDRFPGGKGDDRALVERSQRRALTRAR